MPLKAALGDLEWNIYIAPNHGGKRLRLFLQLFLLGKLTNHF